jgi:transposase
VGVAHQLRVSTKSAYWRWRWRWLGGAGVQGPGRGGMPTERWPGGEVAGCAGGRAGRVGWGEDQRWTLARVTTLIARLFHASYTLRGTSYLLHRLGYSPQVSAHRAAERDEQAIAVWKSTTWVKFDASGGDWSVDLL